MPIEILATADNLGVLISASGSFSEQDYLQFFRNLHTQESESPSGHLYAVSDFSGVTDTTVSSAAVAEVAHLFQSNLNNKSILAIIAPKDLEFGLSRVFEQRVAKTDDLVRVFRSRPEAESWIRESLKQRRGIETVDISPLG